MEHDRPPSPVWSAYEGCEGGASPSSALPPLAVTFRGAPTRSLRRCYRKVCVVQRGAQGVVYAAVPRRSSQQTHSQILKQVDVDDGDDADHTDSASALMHTPLVAVKRMIVDFHDYQFRGMPEGILREVMMMRAARRLWLADAAADAPPFVELREVVKGPRPEDVCLVMEWCPADVSTAAFATALRPAPRQEVPDLAPTPADVQRVVLRSLLAALALLHRHGIVHRDVKASNLLIAPTGAAVRLGDMGSARQTAISATSSHIEGGVSEGAHAKQDPSATTSSGGSGRIALPMTPAARRTTLLYRAPETLLGQSSSVYGPPADLWAAGVVLAELMLTTAAEAKQQLPEGSLTHPQQPLPQQRFVGAQGLARPSARTAKGHGIEHLFAVTGEMALAGAILKLLGPLAGTESFLRRQSHPHNDDDAAEQQVQQQPPPPGSAKRGRSGSDCMTDDATSTSTTTRTAAAVGGNGGVGAAAGSLTGRFGHEEGYDLLRRLLQLDPLGRITAAAALDHPFLTALTPARAAAAEAHIRRCCRCADGATTLADFTAAATAATGANASSAPAGHGKPFGALPLGGAGAGAGAGAGYHPVRMPLYSSAGRLDFGPDTDDDDAYDGPDLCGGGGKGIPLPLHGDGSDCDHSEDDNGVDYDRFA